MAGLAFSRCCHAMCLMAAEAFIQCRVSRATKAALRAAAERQQLTESARPGTSRTTRLNMTDQVGGRQGVGNRLAERMSLQELQMGLLAPLPARNRLEGVDVSADQLCKGDAAMAV